MCIHTRAHTHTNTYTHTHISHAQTTPTSSIPRLSLTQPSFSFTPTQAQWARQRLGEKLDLESPRLLESPRGTYEYIYKYLDVCTQT